MLIIKCGCQVTSELEVEWGEEEEDSPANTLSDNIIRENTQVFLNEFKFLESYDKWSMSTQDHTSWSRAGVSSHGFGR